MVQVNSSFVPVPELSQFKISISADVDASSNPSAFVDEVEANQALWEALQKYPVHHSAVEIGPQ